MNTNNTNYNPGGRDRFTFPAEDAPRLLNNLLNELTAAYEAVGLPRTDARRAALADLECDVAALPIAA